MVELFDRLIKGRLGGTFVSREDCWELGIAIKVPCGIDKERPWMYKCETSILGDIKSKIMRVYAQSG